MFKIPGTSLSINKESLTSFLAILKTSLHAPVKLLPVTQSWNNNYILIFF